MAIKDLNWRDESWNKIKENAYSLEGFSKKNKYLAIEFLKDFELGKNVPKNSKGRRSAGTLLKLRGICIFLNKNFPNKTFLEITQEDLHKLFDEMYKGIIKKEDGKIYGDIGDFIKNSKTFFDWLIRVGELREDVCRDLSRGGYSRGKPSWVYLDHQQIKTLIDNARGDYRALILFLYDSGLRPMEAYRIKVMDFSDDYTTLNIPEKRESGERVSKTFERTIKLKSSSTLLKNYIEINNLKKNDYLILPSQPAFNKYLRELAVRLFGDTETKARGKTNQLKLYDIRHLSSIYWLDKYQTHKDLMYRMGWKREDKVLYYSEFLGRRDKINDEDMLTLEDKTTLEKELDLVKSDNLKMAKLFLELKNKFEELEKGKPLNDSEKWKIVTIPRK